MSSPARRRRNFVAIRSACEPLECRRLLCGLPLHHLPAAPEFDWDVERLEAARLEQRGGPEVTSIVWTNRGQAGDGFAANFGTSAGAGRAVIDAVLDYWERIITNWNRFDGTTTLQVDISITNSNGFGAAAAPNALAPLDGKPRTGSITIQRGNNSPDGNDSNGWFFDPTPFDNSEFVGNIINAYAGVNSAGVGSDLFSVVSAELAHVMGLISDRNNNGLGFNGYLLETLSTDTGLDDESEGGGNGNFWIFEGDTIDHLMTSFNSGDPDPVSWGNVVHTAGVTTAGISFSGRTWFGSDDTGNAIYGNERTLPSFVTAMILKDAYGYSVINPQNFGTFHAVLDETTGELLVRGGGVANSNDVITITRSGTAIEVSVDVGSDVPGTGALPGAGNLPAYLTTFQSSDIDSIQIDGGDGNDTITVNGIHASIPITINAGTGNDTIHLAEAGDNLDAIDSNVTVNGNAGTDILRLFDTSNSFGDTFSITGSTIGRNAFPTLTYGTLETAIINAGSGASTFNATSTTSGAGVAIFAGDGNDTFNVGSSNNVSSIDGSLTLHGQNGTDTVNYNDSANATAGNYTVQSGAISRTGVPNVGTQTMEVINLNAGTAGNTITLAAVASGVTLTVNAGGGNDNLVAGTIGGLANIDGAVTYNGDAGTDTFTIDDTAASGTVAHTITQDSYSRTGFAGMSFDTIEAIELAGNNGNNQYHIDPSPVSLTAEVTINAGSGADSFLITLTAHNAAFIGGDLTLNGGGGTDALLLFDDNSSANMPYSISTTTLIRGIRSMDYSSLESITIHGTSAANDFSVASNTASLALNGNSGNDRLFLGGSAQTLDGIDGNITFSGGSGTDLVDIRDQQSAGLNSYSVQTASFDRSAFPLLSYNSIEDLTLNANDASNTISVPQFESLTTDLLSLTIDAGGGNDTINLGSGDLENELAFVAVTVSGGAGIDSLYLNDSVDPQGSDSYTLTSTTFDKNSSGLNLITFDATEHVSLDANPQSNTINIASFSSITTDLQSLTVNANTGNDTFNLGQGDLETDLAFVAFTLNGDAGTDALNLDDSTDGEGNDSYTLTSTSFDKNTAGLNLVEFATLESIDLDASPFNNAINIQSIASGLSLSVDAGNGNDTFNLGVAGRVESLDGPLTINGQAGSDAINVNDQNEILSFGFNVNPITLTRTGIGTISYGTAELMTINSGSTASIPKSHTVNGTAATTPVTINPGAGTETLHIIETGSTVTIGASAGNDTLNVNASGVGTSDVFLDSSHTLGTLNIGAGGRVTLEADGAHVLRTQDLSVNGTLDLNNNAMIVDYATASPLAAIRAALTAGYASGAWTGTGITSARAANVANHALGYAESSAIFSTFPAVFAGQPVDDTCVLVRYTRYGDTNLDRQVNLVDFNRLAANFGAGTLWSNGNSNYDTTINLLDFNLLAANFGQPVLL